MTVQATVRKAGPTPGNSLATVFPFAFKVFLATDLAVTLKVISTGVETVLVLNDPLGYTVALNPDQNANPGGSITYNPGAVPMPATQALTISSVVPELQGTHIINGGAFFANNIEDAVDKVLINVQDLAVKVAASLQYPVSDSSPIAILPSAVQRANRALTFDGSGNPVMAAVNVSVYGVRLQSFTATAGQVLFNTNFLFVPGVNALAVFVNGIRAEPVADFTETSSTSFQMTYGLAVGDKVVVYGGQELTGLGALLSSVVTYLLGGVGAITRSVQDFINDQPIDIKSFGAVCDGVADDTAAINKAIAAATGKTLTYSGTPLISATIPVNVKLTLIGLGGRGSGTGDLPSSYFKKKATMNSAGLQITAADVVLEGGGVVSTAGDTGDGVRMEANGVTLRDFSAIGSGALSGVGIRVGKDAGVNANSWTLDNINSCGWGSHGYFIDDSAGIGTQNANAGTARSCVALSNGGDGFRCRRATLNTFIGCLAETNIGQGFRMMNGGNNWIIGGDYEANTAGQVLFDSTSNQNGEQIGDLSVVVVDQGFFTKRLGRYHQNQVAYTPCLVGSTGADKNVTAVTIAGAICTATSAAHGYANGDMVWMRGMPNSNLDGAFVISNVAANTFDYTYRTDVNYNAPVTAAAAGIARRGGVYTTAKGQYQYNGGRIDFNANVTTSAKTDLTGALQLILPFVPAVLQASSVYGHATLDFYQGITHVGKLELLIAQNGAVNQNFFHTIGSAIVPVQAQDGVAGFAIAAATTVVASGWYLV